MLAPVQLCYLTFAQPLLGAIDARTLSELAVLETDHLLRASTAVVTPLMLTANSCCPAA
jgi:hypothetical protein